MTPTASRPTASTPTGSLAETDGPAGAAHARGRGGGLRPILVRLHVLGGLLAAPVVLSLALTGILFAWNPQIESVLYADTMHAATAGPARPLGEQVAAAQQARPGWTVTEIVPAGADASTTAVMLVPPGTAEAAFGAPDNAVTEYVAPDTARVTGEIVEGYRPDNWLRSLHSSWRLGPVAEPLTELAASWALVSVLTGLYLWWPRSRRGLVRTLLPSFRRTASPRARWRRVHTSLGVWLAISLILMIGTGLTWTNVAGAWVDVAKSALSSQAPAVTASLTAPGAGGHGGHGGHGGGAGHGGSARGQLHPTDVTSGVDRAMAAATWSGLDGAVEIKPPADEVSPWEVSQRDSTWPVERSSIAVAPSTGSVIDRVDWADFPLLVKATTIGIAFHEGELFGVANQIYLTLLAVGLVVLIVAGYRMWWIRRPRGELGIPSRAGSMLRTTPVPLLVGFAVLMILLPTLGVTLLGWLLVERLIVRFRGRRVRSAEPDRVLSGRS